MKTAHVTNTTRQLPIPINLRVCATFINRLKGLMFVSELEADSGILLVENQASRIGASIHMFFMFFDICVVWLDSNFQVVDRVIARRGHPFYAPRQAARYTIEIHPEQFNHFLPGDKIHIDYA